MTFINMIDIFTPPLQFNLHIIRSLWYIRLMVDNIRKRGFNLKLGGFMIRYGHCRGNIGQTLDASIADF